MIEAAKPIAKQAAALVAAVLISACGAATPKTYQVSGGISGVLSQTTLTAGVEDSFAKRSAALLGIFIAEYLSVAPTAVAAQGGLQGVEAQMEIAIGQSTVQDPDFELLQAFADALGVDVADLLNRSPKREASLEAYIKALNTVAERSNDRYKELTASLETIKDELRALGKTRSTAERDLNKAIKEKDFSAAGEKQKALNEAQEEYSTKDLQRKQIEELTDTLERLLKLYSEKILAIEKNREPLILGTSVVDVPGAEELEVLEKTRGSRRSLLRRSNDSEFDALFEDSTLP